MAASISGAGRLVQGCKKISAGESEQCTTSRDRELGEKRSDEIGFVSSSFTTDPEFLASKSSISQIQTSYCTAMDKRAVQRSPVLKAGTIEFPGGAFSCMVRNLSEQGAALDVPSLAGIPHDFILVIPLEGRRFYCRSVWRKERRIGVSFE